MVSAGNHAVQCTQLCCQYLPAQHARCCCSSACCLRSYHDPAMHKSGRRQTLTCLTVCVTSFVLLLGPMQQVTRYKQHNIQLRGLRWSLGVHTNCMMSGSHCKPHTLPEDAMEMSSCGEEEASSRTMLKAVAGMLSVFAAGRQPAGP